MYTFNILHDSMFCSALISRMLIMQNVHLEQSKRITPAVLYHSKIAIKQLQQRLSCPEHMCSDVVITAMSSQAVLQLCAKLVSLNWDDLTFSERLAGQCTTFATHFNAVRRLK